MPNYIRALEGNTFFFTVVTYRRWPILCEEACLAALREVLREVKAQHPFAMPAWVVLPDHLHCIWRLPGDDGDFSLRWALIKKEFTKRVQDILPPMRATPAGEARREGTVWQHRFWEHRIRDEEDYRAHCDYIHYNPVKHGVALIPSAWPHTSLRHYVEVGYYPKDWGAASPPTIAETTGHE